MNMVVRFLIENVFSLNFVCVFKAFRLCYVSHNKFMNHILEDNKICSFNDNFENQA